MQDHAGKAATQLQESVRVASAQFPVSADVSANAEHIIALMAEAASARAQLAVFPETALCGYLPWECPSMAEFDWEALNRCTQQVALQARVLSLWVVVGSAIASDDPDRPFNSVLVFDPEGRLYGHYDKRLLTDQEQAHFTPGTDPLVFEVSGLRCGLAICHEWRYPEIYRQYAQLGVDAVVQCWYDGGYSDAQWARGASSFGDVIPNTARGHAVCNHFWLIGSNTSSHHSCFAPFFIQPDGVLYAMGDREKTQIVIADLTLPTTFDDPSAHHRPRLVKAAGSVSVLRPTNVVRVQRGSVGLER
eukprot:gene2918-573_t